MSGIAGILQLDGAPVDRAMLQRMTNFLAFRGLDALEIWSDGAVGFGHALLRTELSGGVRRQPCTLDGRAWITADARLDAREELITKLAARGREEAKTAEDAELLLHAYHLWGTDCLEHLLGDYVFAIWDAGRRRLWCARDPLGTKPFFYALVGRVLIFSNTLDCLRLHPGVSERLNELAIADFLLFGGNQDPATTSFADIQRLPAAHQLEWSRGALRLARYWTLAVEDVLRYRRPGDYVEHFLELFGAGVADRVRTGRVSVQMSGGLDSTSVAAVARRALAGSGAAYELRAFTVDFRPLLAGDEELRYAHCAADAMGIPLEPLSGAEYAPFQGREQPGLRTPEPVDQPLRLLQQEQFRRMAAHGRVALSGDGGDVILHGQSWPYLTELCRKGKLLDLAREFGGYVLSHGRLPPLLGGFRARLRRWLGRPAEQGEYPVWLNRDLEKRLGLRQRWEELQRESAAVHPIRPAAYRMLTDGLWTAILESQDAGVTRFALEVRQPFFDLRLVRFLLRVPPLPWCAEKELLRAAMRGLLPEEVRLRPKAPLAGDPLWEWIQQKGWRPQKDFVPTPDITHFVDPGRLVAAAGPSSPGVMWLILFALSLNYWLQFSLRCGYKLDAEATCETSFTDNSEEALSQSQVDHLRQSR